MLVTVPLLTAIAFAALAVFTTVGDAVQAGRLRSLVHAGAAAGDLSYLLQSERTAAVAALTERSTAVDEFEAESDRTDEAITAYVEAAGRLSDLPGDLTTLLDRIGGQLTALPELRERVSTGTAPASATAFRYRILIADLVTYRDSIVQTTGVRGDVADRIRAAATLASAAEHAGAEQYAVSRAIERGRLSPAAQQQITASRSGYVEALLAFDALADPDWRAWLESALSGGDAVAAQLLEDDVARTRPGRPVDIDADAWNEAMSARLAHMRVVQELIDEDIAEQVTSLRDSARLWAGVQAGLVALAVLLAVWLAVRLGRPVVQGLRRLRDTARRVAGEDLPGVVARLNEAKSLGDLTPEQYAGSHTERLPDKGTDELSEVARAFNQVHAEAVRVAAEQAVLRLHIAQMFVELARRGNSLTSRLTKALDDAERREEDPEWLERLFSFDHMVTLLSRRNNSLLVLGGSSPAHARARDEPLSDVVRAAQSQVEYYTRVHTDTVTDEVAVRASAVDEIVILLAELIDNATRFSQHVRVTGSALADRLILQIGDDGIGMDPGQRERLNGRLAFPKLDLDALHAMGLTVVGTIAARHGIVVELRGNEPNGTIAEVTVPMKLLVREPVERPAGEGASTPAAPLFQKRAAAAAAPDGGEPEVPAPLFRRNPAAEPVAETAPPAAHEPGEPDSPEPVSPAPEPVSTRLFAGTGVPGGGAAARRRPSPYPASKRSPDASASRYAAPLSAGRDAAESENADSAVPPPDQHPPDRAPSPGALRAETPPAEQGEPQAPAEHGERTPPTVPAAVAGPAERPEAPAPDPEPAAAAEPDPPAPDGDGSGEPPADPAAPTATLTDQDTVALPMLGGNVPRPEPDDGWTHITDAAAALVDGGAAGARTETGKRDPAPALPQRSPMARLVPGGLPEPERTADAPGPGPTGDYRDPAAVGATFAAYARGTSQHNTTMSVTTDREPDSDRA